MEKVEIITLQRVANYGSVLQAYATQKIIEEFGYNAELINYKPSRMTMKGMLSNLKNKNKLLKKSIIIRTGVRLIMLPSYIKRFHTFNKFTNKYLKMTPLEYKNNNELKENIPKGDIYVTGSDQVWNSEWNGEIDKALFLDFVPKNKKCISYAASFGKNNLDENEKKETKELLKKYQNLSVREMAGKDILNELGYKSEVVLDPTLLINGNEWSKLASKKYEGKKYIFVYNLNRNKKIDEYAKKISKEKNLSIYYVTYSLHEFYKKGKMKCSVSVEDFLSLVKNAQYVVTDSFHATAFSINFNTNFMIVFPEKFSSRVKSILKITNLENRVVKDINDISLTQEQIDYQKVNKIIEKERNNSLEWLKNSLEE